MLNAVFAILPLCFSPVLEKDSVKQTDTAIVRALRHDFLAESIVSRDLRINSTGLSELLLENGIYLKQYGFTGLSTLSIRGADPQQMQVVWNGIVVSNPMAGMMDLNNITLSGSENIHIYQGGTASLYGSGNVGGTLMISTPTTTKNSAASSSKLSNYGNHYQGLNFNFHQSGWSFANYSVIQGGPNNFSYRTFENGSLQTLKMKYAASSKIMQRNILSFQKGKFKIKGISEINANERHPGMTLTGPAGGVLYDRSKRFLLEGNLIGKNSVINARSALFFDFIRYADSAAGADDTSNSRIFTNQLEYVLKWKKWNWITGLDIQFLTAKAEAYFHKIYTIYPAQWIAFVRPFHKWIFSGNARFEWNEKIPIISASIAKQIQKFQIKVCANSSFRRPALNDLFWARENNPTLVPEFGKMAELGINYSQQKRLFKIKISNTLYTRKLINPIFWIYENAEWKAVNMYQGVYSGTQGAVDIQYKNLNNTIYGFIVNADFVNSQITWNAGESSFRRIFMPALTGNAMFYASIRKFKFHINGIYTGNRNMTHYDSEKMPAYFLLNLKLAHDFVPKKSLYKINTSIHFLNCTNTQYQVMPGRPMPLRGVEFQLKILYNS